MIDVIERITTNGYPTEPPADAEQRSEVEAWLRGHKVTGHEGYLALLEQTNGVDANGMVIYAATARPSGKRGIIEANRHDGALEKGIVVIGGADDDAFIYSPTHGKWGTIDAGSIYGEILYEEFETATDLLEFVFDEYLPATDTSDSTA